MSTRIKVQIQFKHETPKEFETCDVLEQALKEFHGDDNVAIHCSDMEHQGEEVYLELSSNRHYNALWQQGLLIEFIRDNFEIINMDTDVWRPCDDEGISLTGEEILTFKSIY